MNKAHKAKKRKHTPRVLIIATHPDDEAIGCGEKIISCIKHKLPFKIVIITSSVHNNRKLYPNESSEIREQESRNMLKFTGGKSSDIIFLRASNHALLDENIFFSTMRKLERIMSKFRPTRLYVPCYEGGNLEHDLTSFLVYTLFKTKNLFGKIGLFEYPEYSSKISFADLKKLKRFFFGKQFAPYFINSKSKVFYNDENFLAEKKQLLTYYTSQKPAELIKIFGFRDRYRKFTGHDYMKPPYSLISLNSFIGIFIKGFKLYDGIIAFNHFKKFIILIEEKLD